jgi:hypothetical protein
MQNIPASDDSPDSSVTVSPLPQEKQVEGTKERKIRIVDGNKKA